MTEDPAIREAWQQFYDRKDESGQTLCLVTGKKDKLAVLHPSIKGVRGAQAMGASLVSFNGVLLCSYEKEQGANAPVGEYAAFAHTTALNELLNDRAHTGTIGDTTVVCWAEGGESLYQDVGMMAMFGLTDESGMTDGELRAIIGKVANGGAGTDRGYTTGSRQTFLCAGTCTECGQTDCPIFYEGFFWHYDPACQ